MASFDDDYDVRTFSPALVGDVPDDATRDWIAATRIAFHQSGDPDAVVRDAVGAAADGRVLTGVYAREPLEGGLDVLWPVATYAGYTKTINVGGGALVDSYLISDVTVRPTHKRRGILRHMMTSHLRTAADSGLALAALTASESTIYRRFGFGVATRERTISIRHGNRFALHVEPTGRCELASARDLGDIARAVFAEFHARTPGSVDRQHQLWERKLGIAGETGKPDTTIRAAVHFSEGGSPDGFVTYRMKDEGSVSVLEVIDLVAADSNAYLGLWKFVGSVDLVERITFGAAPVVDPLSEALVESRSLVTEGDADHVWLRILDPIAALSARPYAADGRLTMRVHDSLGFADGLFELTVVDGAGALRRVDPVDDATAADLELDVATLASMYLGGSSTTVLAEAGLVVARDTSSVMLATTMFAPDRPVYGITHF